MYEIHTHLPNGKAIERFNSFKEAHNEWTRFNPWHGGCLKELFHNGKFRKSNR